MAAKRSTYIGEIEWAIGQLYCAHHDRNPNRSAQIDGLLKYANEVLIARRSRGPLPPRPDVKKMI